jgi:ribosomal protein L11 methyltransferase
VLQSSEFQISYSLKNIADENWNAKWESDYDSVIIDNRCYIRAPFHKVKPEIEFEILIEPKMSFGTAHHETTAQMIQLLLGEDVEGKTVLDMGCGTAVLAILAKKKNAATVHAIDNDEWAYNNSVENVQRNNFTDIIVEQGDAALLKDRTFDVILANINKNILLADMEIYANSMHSGAIIMFSGFYKNDLEDIKSRALIYGLQYIMHIDKNDWVAAKFLKK